MKKNNTTKNQEQAKKSTWIERILTAVLIVCAAGLAATEYFPAPASDIVFVACLAVGIFCVVVWDKLQSGTETSDNGCINSQPNR